MGAGDTATAIETAHTAQRSWATLTCKVSDMIECVPIIYAMKMNAYRRGQPGYRGGTMQWLHTGKSWPRLSL